MGEASERHEPWCDSQLGPDFEVSEDTVRMTIHVCLGCKGEPPPAPEPDPRQASGGEGES